MTILGFGTPQLKENPREKYEYAEKKSIEREMDISKRQATIKLKNILLLLYSHSGPARHTFLPPVWHRFSIVKCSSLAAFYKERSNDGSL